MILTDVDGVLLDWFGGFRDFLLWKGIEVENAFEPADWSMVGYVNHPNIQGLIAEFNSSPEFGELMAYADALITLQNLHAQGHEVVAITSCSADPAVHAMRLKNLESEFGFKFKDLICLPLMKSKTAVLSQYTPNPGTIWVEDSLHGAQSGVETGHKTFLINRRYNVGHETNRAVVRVDNWFDIDDHIQ